jgi:hypothetical protein
MCVSTVSPEMPSWPNVANAVAAHIPSRLTTPGQPLMLVRSQSLHAVFVGQRHDMELNVQRLLDELCTRLGFCLPPDEQRRLRGAPPATVDHFTDAVFEAEGIGDIHDTQLHRQVRNVVDKHMSRWAQTERESLE